MVPISCTVVGSVPVQELSRQPCQNGKPRVPSHGAVRSKVMPEARLLNGTSRDDVIDDRSRYNQRCMPLETEVEIHGTHSRGNLLGTQWTC